MPSRLIADMMGAALEALSVNSRAGSDDREYRNREDTND
jgi:hypothetical protein